MTREAAGAPAGADVRWKDVWIATTASLLLTLALGAPLFFLVEQSVWWVALAGVVGLFAGGVLVAQRLGGADALGATLVAIFYYATVLLVLVGGTLADLLPDPLPGLPIGDSTFFFVWPLAQLVAAVLGALVAHWRPRRLPR